MVVGVVHTLVATVGTVEDVAFLWRYVLDELDLNDEDDGDMKYDVLGSAGADPPTAAAAAISLSSESYSSLDWLCWNDVILLLRLRSFRPDPASDLDAMDLPVLLLLLDVDVTRRSDDDSKAESGTRKSSSDP